jgi:hypothetical protein
MPWCDECSKFWSPNSIPASGKCPTCGRLVAEPLKRPSLVSMMSEDGDEDYKAPWHFKLMIVVAGLYIGFRIVQMVTWVV